jgi:hypothetical protein
MVTDPQSKHGRILPESGSIHCRKGLLFSRPQPGYPWPGIIKLFPARESLVSDIPAGDGKMANPFLQCNPVFSYKCPRCRAEISTLELGAYGSEQEDSRRTVGILRHIFSSRHNCSTPALTSIPSSRPTAGHRHYLLTSIPSSLALARCN